MPTGVSIWRFTTATKISHICTYASFESINSRLIASILFLQEENMFLKAIKSAHNKSTSWKITNQK